MVPVKPGDAGADDTAELALAAFAKSALVHFFALHA